MTVRTKGDPAPIWIDVQWGEARSFRVNLRMVRCPSCHSTKKKCMRPSGWEATEWHIERRRLLDKLLLKASVSDVDGIDEVLF